MEFFIVQLFSTVKLITHVPILTTKDYVMGLNTMGTPKHGP